MEHTRQLPASVLKTQQIMLTGGYAAFGLSQSHRVWGGEWLDNASAANGDWQAAATKRVDRKVLVRNDVLRSVCHDTRDLGQEGGPGPT